MNSGSKPAVSLLTTPAARTASGSQARSRSARRYLGEVLRVLCSRRWLGWHVLLVAGVLACILLGRWQWHRAESPTGTLQNLAYAYQWWFFAALAVYGWAREVRADVRAARSGAGAGVPPPPAAALGDGLGRVPAGVAPAPQEEPDEEVAAYNAYLAALAARDERRRVSAAAEPAQQIRSTVEKGTPGP